MRREVQPGERGRLRLRAHVEDELIEHEDDVVFVGRLDAGVLAFAPAAAVPLYLHESEVISWSSAP